MSQAELPEDIRAAIGRVHYREQSDFFVESGYVQTLCAAVQNGNPLYWDSETADAVTGGPTAPLSMLSVWLRPHHWAPGRSGSVKPLGRMRFSMKDSVCPGDTLQIDGRIEQAQRDARGCGWLQVVLEMSVAGTMMTQCHARLALPLDASDNTWQRRGYDWQP